MARGLIGIVALAWMLVSCDDGVIDPPIDGPSAEMSDERPGLSDPTGELDSATYEARLAEIEAKVEELKQRVFQRRGCPPVLLTETVLDAQTSEGGLP